MPAHEHSSGDEAPRRAFLATPAGLVLIGFLAIAAFFLVTEHSAHLFGILPWLFLAACPLMHLFMHHGHGGHESDRYRDASGDRRSEASQH